MRQAAVSSPHVPAARSFHPSVFALLLLASLAGVALLAAWVELSPLSLGPLSAEDGPLENLTALLFFTAGVAFLIAAKRSQFLRSQGSPWAYLMIVAWAGLAFVCAGEEISWGQRLLGFDAPQGLQDKNLQQEFNLHNLEAFFSVGGTYRALSIFVLLTGLVIPAIALTGMGRRFFSRVCFPVAPLVLAPAFIGAYLFGRYYLEIAPSQVVKPLNAINEARELLIGYALALFAITGAAIPDALFRALSESPPSAQSRT